MVTQHQINHLINHIVTQFQPERIILFGSYAYGKPTVDSDVDLLVVMPVRNEAVREKAVEIYIAIDKAKAAPFSFDLLVRTPKQMLRRIAIHDFFIREICEKGKTLYATTPPAACGGGFIRESADLVGFSVVEGYAIRP